MAKILLGGNVSQISGSVGGTVYSRNRYGAYERSRVHPTRVTSKPASDAKTILSGVSGAWAGLAEDYKAAWRQYAVNNPIMDRVGMRQALDGHAMFVKVNARLLAAKQDALTLPVMGEMPGPISTAELTAHSVDSALSLAFGEAALTASQMLQVWGCVVDSAGKSYVDNLLRCFFYSELEAASPVDLLDAWVARFGEMSAGEFIHLRLYVLDSLTGLRSQPFAVVGEVTLGS